MNNKEAVSNNNNITTFKNGNVNVNETKMAIFTNNISGVFDYINKTDYSNALLNPKITQKQYLAYYLYRIICKFQDSIESILSSSKLKKEIYDLLKIPEGAAKTCFPLSNKMIKDETSLDVVISNMLNILNIFDVKHIDEEAYKPLDDLVGSKNSIEIISSDLIKLSSYIPNLSGSVATPNIKSLVDYTKRQKTKGKDKLTNANPKNINTMKNNNNITNNNIGMKNDAPISD